MKRYADDYEIVITEDENGREKKTAVYRGSYYDISVDQQHLLKFRRNCLFLIAAIIVLHTAGGFVANPGMYQFYVVLPYVFGFLPIYYMVVGGLRLPKTTRKFRRDEIGLSFDRIRKANLFSLIFSGLVVIGEIVFMIWFAGEGRSLEFPFIMIEMLSLIGAYFLYRLQISMQTQITIEK